MEETVVAYSDCLDVQESHFGTKLMEYSNKFDYAGISFDDFDITFGIRIHGRFFEERSPEKDETDSLTDESVVELSNEIKSQKLLEVEPAPSFFHQIVKYALKHNKKTIDSEDWSKEGDYEMERLGAYNPFYIAKVWLTKKEGEFFTNVFGEDE